MSECETAGFGKTGHSLELTKCPDLRNVILKLPYGHKLCLTSQESRGLQEFRMVLKLKITVAPQAYDFFVV